MSDEVAECLSASIDNLERSVNCLAIAIDELINSMYPNAQEYEE